MIPKVLHEHVVHRAFGAGVEESLDHPFHHVHILVWCEKPFTWVKTNLQDQLGYQALNMKPIYTYYGAVEACSYLCKERLPQLWSVNEAVSQQLKKDIRSVCIAYRQRQIHPTHLKRATEQLHRIEQKWFPEPNLNESQLAQELFGSQPDSSAYSIGGSQPL